MPLARFAMHAKGEQIHAAVWPEVPDIHHLASRHHAFEGRCYVICVGTYMTTADLPEGFELGPVLGEAGNFGEREGEILPGGSGIIGVGPDSQRVAGPVSGRRTSSTARSTSPGSPRSSRRSTRRAITTGRTCSR
jgi:hypothetical protein